MKKITFLLLLGIIITMLFIFYKQFFSENREVKQEVVEVVEVVEEIEFRLSGYYYFGFLDQRDKEDSEFEKDYFYNMDIHFQDYYNNLFVISRDDNNDDNNPE